jgi:ribosomal protein L37AE/L43A
LEEKVQEDTIRKTAVICKKPNAIKVSKNEVVYLAEILDKITEKKKRYVCSECGLILHSNIVEKCEKCGAKFSGIKGNANGQTKKKSLNDGLQFFLFTLALSIIGMIIVGAIDALLATAIFLIWVFPPADILETLGSQTVWMLQMAPCR